MIKLRLIYFLVFPLFACGQPLVKDVKINKFVRVNYLDNQVIKMESIVDSVKNGVSVSFYQSAKVASVSIFKNNILTSQYMAYYPNGELMYKGSFRSDSLIDTLIRERECIISSDSIYEVVCEDVEYRGMKEGAWIYYFNNGIIQYEGIYENGVKNGEWKIYDIYGNLTKRENWITGNKVSVP